MEGIADFLNKISIEDIEKVRLIMSLVPEKDPKEIVTLRVFIVEYKNTIKQNRSENYYRSVEIAFNHFTNYLPEQIPISSITLKDVESFMTYLQQKVAKGYAVYFRNLKAAFYMAKDRGYVKENFFTKIKLPKRQKMAPAYIDSRQLAIISEQIRNDIVRNVVVFAFYTGMRLDEIVNLRWKNIDLNNRSITVGDELFLTKGRKQRFIPICDEVYDILNKINSTKYGCKTPIYSIPRGNNKVGFVFCKSNGEKFTGDYFTKRFKRACKLAGVDNAIHFHSLRHSFASSLVQKDVSLYKIKELLGHSSISTTEIYSHLNIDSLREAIKTLDDDGPDRTSWTGRTNSIEKRKCSTGLKLIIKK